jgi:hypothetical protein
VIQAPNRGLDVEYDITGNRKNFPSAG